MDRPATLRQRAKLLELGIEHELDITMDEATKILRDLMEMIPRNPIISMTALAVAGEGDRYGGRQWED